jgi:hypothetical protein
MLFKLLLVTLVVAAVADTWCCCDVLTLSMDSVQVWNSGNSVYLSTVSYTVTIPNNRTSSVWVVSASSPQATGGMRTCGLLFYNGCLTLPAGLEYVDDLQGTAAGTWAN